MLPLRSLNRGHTTSRRHGHSLRKRAVTMRLPHLLPGSFVVFDVNDPADMDSDSRVSRRFPKSNNFNTYVLRVAARRRQPPQGEPLTRLAVRTLDDLTPCFVADRFGTEVSIVGSGAHRFCLTVMLHGRMLLRSGATQAEVPAEGERGLVYCGVPGTRFLTDDDNARFNLWVSAHRVEQMLEGFLDAPLRGALTFAPAVDWSTGLMASLRALLRLLLAELEREDGLASSPPALSSYTDLLVQTMLRALPHNHQDRLGTGKPDLVPGHLRRAEDYMRAHADQPVSMQGVAQAAGCSLRSIHEAFRRWRGTTPLAALHQVRLEQVRTELSRLGGDATPQAAMEIARRFGFTNRTRFLAAYGHRFGEPPPGTKRLR